MPEFSIRAATTADAPAILFLLRELAAYEKLLEHFSLTEEMVRRDMLGGACHCELVFVGDTACGIATWFWTYMSFRARRGLYVEDLFVQPHHRGQGLGKAMLAQLAARARDANGYMEWRVLDWNSRATIGSSTIKGGRYAVADRQRRNFSIQVSRGPNPSWM